MLPPYPRMAASASTCADVPRAPADTRCSPLAATLVGRHIVTVVKSEYLTGRLLLAMPGMFDPRFEHSVNVICVHDGHGALGLNVGRPRPGIRLHAILRELDIEPGQAPDCQVLEGGPVEPERGFVLHSTDWQVPATIPVEPLCAMTYSLDVLRAIAQGNGPSRWLVALGYAGWSAGQLEQEMRQHGWYAARGQAETLFDTPATARWSHAWQGEGVDPALLAPEIGSA